MLEINDWLDAVFLGSFLFGVLFAVVSLVLGAADLEIGSSFFGDGATGASGEDGAGPVNVSTVLAFIAWFGGIGYLARNGFGWVSLLSVGLAVVGGLGGAALVYQFLVRVVAPADKALDPADYRLPGTLARVTSSIRPGGTGEIIFEQAGVRQVSAARTSDGKSIERGTEVVVLEANRGVALVEPWETLVAADEGEQQSDKPALAVGPPGPTARDLP